MKNRSSVATTSSLKNRVGISTKINRPARKESAVKFELQSRYEPKRRTRVNPDTDRSDCCGCEILWFEGEYGSREFGGYEGCECCGAMSGIPQERPEPQPMTAKEIQRAMDDTYQSCGHDVDGDWPGSSVLDFIVSLNGHYASHWDSDAFAVTSRETKQKAVAAFNRMYGFTERS